MKKLLLRSLVESLVTVLTYLSLMLSEASGGVFSVSAPFTDDASSLINPAFSYTHKISGGSAETVNDVDFQVLRPGVIPANFSWTSTGDQNEVLNNEGDWVPANGGITGGSSLHLLKSFTYAANGTNAGHSQTFTLSDLTPGVSYSTRLYMRTWDKGNSGRPIDFTFTNGAEIDSYNGLLEDRPGTVLGTGNQDQAYFLQYQFTAQSNNLLINAAVPPSAAVNSGSFHLYGLTNHVLAPTIPRTASATISAGPVRDVSPYEVGGGVPAGWKVYQFRVTTSADILRIGDITIEALAHPYNHISGSDAEPPNPLFVAVFPALGADSWITTPGNTAIDGNPGDDHFGTIAHSWFDTVNNGPQSNFLFAQFTIPPGHYHFQGQVSLAGLTGPESFPFAFGPTTGDYNENGVVDAADYPVWRKTLGQIGTDLAADGYQDHEVNFGDYDVWGAAFGQTAFGSGAGTSAGSSNASVPEPANLILLILATLGGWLRQGRIA